MSREWLINWRKEKYTSQTATAKAAGLTSSRYSRIENGYCDIRPEEASGLAKAFSVSPEEVLTGAKARAVEKTPPTASPPGVHAPAPVAPAARVAEPNATANPEPAPQPKGDDLSDPKNFTLQPPIEQLITRQELTVAQRAKLQQSLAYAERIMHTSKVRAAVWVAWRNFARDALKCLTGQLAIETPVAPVVPLRPPPPAPTNSHVIAANPSPEEPSAGRKFTPRHNKNIFGHFMDIAREQLPKEVIGDLTDLAATAKMANPEVGFMKHFRRIAGERLTPAVLETIQSAAAARLGTTN